MEAPIETTAVDPTVPDRELAEWAAGCCAAAEGVWPPSPAVLAEIRAAQIHDPQTLVAARAPADGPPAGLRALGLPDPQGESLLQFLAVRPEWRRRGIGRLLEARAASLARRHGARRIRTGPRVSLRNQAGVAFLQRLGWRDEGAAGIRMWRALEELPPAVVPGGCALRSYRDGDGAAIVRVKNAAFDGLSGGGEPWTEADVRREYLDSPLFRPERVFLAWCADQPVGTATAWRAEHEGREVGLVHWVAVSPAHRGRGIGLALCLQVLHVLRAEGCREAILNTNSSLRAAVRLYHRLGFREYWRWLRFARELA